MSDNEKILAELTAIKKSLDNIEQAQRLLLRARRIPVTPFRERIGNQNRRNATRGEPQ